MIYSWRGAASVRRRRHRSLVRLINSRLSRTGCTSAIKPHLPSRVLRCFCGRGQLRREAIWGDSRPSQKVSCFGIRDKKQDWPCIIPGWIALISVPRRGSISVGVCLASVAQFLDPFTRRGAAAYKQRRGSVLSHGVRDGGSPFRDSALMTKVAIQFGVRGTSKL